MKGKKENRYIVIIDNSGEDSETEIIPMTKKEIIELDYRNEIAIIEGNVIKGFDSKFDKGRLK